MENKAEARRPRGNGCFRLVLFPIPLQGHINPMIQLAHLLHSKGFKISIIHTEFNSPDQSNYPEFDFHFIPDGVSDSDASTSDVMELLKLLNINCLAPFRECLSRLLSDDSDEPVACLITDAIWHSTQHVADSLKIPWIVFRTTSICSFLAFAALPLLQEKGYLPKKDPKSEAQVVELPPLKVKDIPVIKTANQDETYKAIGKMIESTRASSGVILNTFKELEEAELPILHKQFQIPSFTIGPVHKSFTSDSSSLLTQDHSSVSWLDSQPRESVVYVSFGSIAQMDEREFCEVAWGLANSKQPFLWVVRPGSVHGSGWLEKLPDGFLEAVAGRGYIVKWAPQQDVLAHPAVGCFWTHSGWNSTLESICEGVPMICSPFFGDQMVNSRYVNDVWKIGVQLERGLQRGDIEKAIKLVLVEEGGAEMRRQIMRLKEIADVCMEPGGSSCQSLESFIDYILSHIN